MPDPVKLREKKDKSRKSASVLLKEMSETEWGISSKRIAEAVLGSCEYVSAKSIFSYVSIGKEPDTRILIDRALDDGKEVYVPKCLKKPEMVAVKISGLDDLEPGAFGIPEPVIPENAADPNCGNRSFDLAVVPCVCASKDGRRLGHGAGYYDCFLEKHKAFTMCLCHEALLTDDVPTEKHDKKMDAVATGGKIFYTK